MCGNHGNAAAADREHKLSDTKISGGSGTRPARPLLVVHHTHTRVRSRLFVRSGAAFRPPSHAYCRPHLRCKFRLMSNDRDDSGTGRAYAATETGTGEDSPLMMKDRERAGVVWRASEDDYDDGHNLIVKFRGEGGAPNHSVGASTI